MLLSMYWRPSISRHSQLSGMYLGLATVLILSWQDQGFSRKGYLTVLCGGLIIFGVTGSTVD